MEGALMKVLIAFPNKLDLDFFVNEISSLKKHFARIVVISYYGDKSKYDEIAKRYDLEYFMVKENSWLNFLNINIFKWLFSKDVIREIKRNCSFSHKGIKKFARIIYYGLFYINSKKFILKELKRNGDNQFYLYSFWLADGAYTVSKFYDLKSKYNIKKIFSRAHRYDLYIERNKLNYIPFRTYIDCHLDEIHFISEDGLRYYESHISSNKKLKKFVSRLGTSNPNGIRKKIYSKDTITIGSCSRITQVKRLDLIIDVLSKIPYNFHWIHIGDGVMGKEIKEYAAKKLPTGSFEFLGYLSNEKVLDVYFQYDVDFFINLSDSEGIPVSIMEAMSIGIPVIARDVGGTREIVNPTNGLILKEPLEENFDEKIIEFMKYRLDNIEYYKHLSNNCLKIWEDKYNLEKNNEMFIKKILEE